MAFSIVNSPLTDQVLNALCNTLVHSLWQGILLAAAAGLIVVLTKRASSALRYNLLIAALVLFATGTVITFGVQLQHINYADAVTVVNHTAPVQLSATPAVNQPVSFTAMITGYLNTYHNSIILIWFLIICAKSIQLGVGLYGTYRLKSVNTVAAGGFWNERMQQLAAMMGIRQGISLLESGIAKVPMVIGHLKPVVLIPIGLLTALGAEEVEAILVHELAHIKRRDYLVNMLQSLMEIVFFFNPAVLWISQLIKTERENCCDDMAIEQSSNKVSYIRALVSCEEYQSAVPAYAMGLPGSKNTLLDRVKRMATNRNHSLNLFEKTLLCVCLVISGICVSAFAEKENIRKAVHEVVKAFEHKGLNPAGQQKLNEQTNLLKSQTEKLRQNTPILTATAPQLQIMDDTNRKVKVTVAPINTVQPLIPQINVGLPPFNAWFASLNAPLGSLNGAMQPLTLTLPIFNNILGDYGYGFNDTTKKSKVKTKVDSTVNVNTDVKVNTDVRTDVRTNVNGNYTYTTSGNNTYGSSNTYNTVSIAPKAGSNYSYITTTTAPNAGSDNGSGSSYSTTTTAPKSRASGSSGSNSYSATSLGYGLSTKSYSNSAPGVPGVAGRPGVAGVAGRPGVPSASTIGPNPASVQLVDELVKAGLIKDKDNVKVRLNSKELIIDGVKQSEENHQLMMKKFLGNRDDSSININYKNSSDKKESAPKSPPKHTFTYPNIYSAFLAKNC